jgi:hypothetical protein
MGQPKVEDAGCWGKRVVCPPADFPPMIRTDQKTNSLQFQRLCLSHAGSHYVWLLNSHTRITCYRKMR